MQVTSGTTLLATYSYDGLGRRIQKSTSGTTDFYLADQQVLETDYTPSGGTPALQYQYVWSPCATSTPRSFGTTLRSGARRRTRVSTI